MVPFSVFKVRLAGLDGPCTWSQEGRPQVVSPAPHLSEGRAKPSFGRRGSDPLLFASACALASGTPSAPQEPHRRFFLRHNVSGDGFRDFGWGRAVFSCSSVGLFVCPSVFCQLGQAVTPYLGLLGASRSWRAPSPFSCFPFPFPPLPPSLSPFGGRPQGVPLPFRAQAH